jgi:hypothetical protein
VNPDTDPGFSVNLNLEQIQVFVNKKDNFSVSVADPDSLNQDPDSAFQVNPDLDPGL